MLSQKEINFVEQLILIVGGIILFIWWFNRDSGESKPMREYIKETFSSSMPELKRFVSAVPSVKKLNKKEEMCRSILEKVFGMPFPTIRPKWLRNPSTNRPLELDCYNEQLKLAIEYDGEQHYKHVQVFHNSPDDLGKQIERDSIKTKLCRENGVNLVRVPYWIKPENLENYILSEIKSVMSEGLN